MTPTIPTDNNDYRGMQVPPIASWSLTICTVCALYDQVTVEMTGSKTCKHFRSRIRSPWRSLDEQIPLTHPRRRLRDQHTALYTVTLHRAFVRNTEHTLYGSDSNRSNAALAIARSAFPRRRVVLTSS